MMADHITFGAYVTQLSDNGAQLCVAGSTDWPFWISRTKGVAWAEPPEVGKYQMVVLSRWAAKFHKQLSSALELETRTCADHRPVEQCVTTSSTQTAKESEAMNDKPQDDGHGALFKNDKREKPSHPDYRGDVTIKGRKFWVSGWIKEGQKGKYMSLAFRQAEDEKPRAVAKAKVAAPLDDDLEIPF